MPKLTLNGEEIEFEQGMTVLQVCELADIEVPRFCYHEKLKIAGNCRMCLVQIEGGPPKPAASCAMPAGDGMVVHTNSPMVKKAREGVMEFLLINHPLDCPICDQGGECDLQDQAVAYGRGDNRFSENKRSVKDKDMGPLIKTQMTRCIHCTRCVRFAEDIAGVPELGTIGRGENMEISTYIQSAISSEMSGNMIDLCPVGALTSKPYAFKARSWELRKTESIDVLDAVGSNIRVDSRGNEVMRILPRLNENINEEWISDKTRFSCDGLKNQRLDRPYIRQKGKLKPASWDEAFTAIKQRLSGVSGDKIAAIAGDMADAESMLLLKELFSSIECHNIDCRQDGAKLDNLVRTSYIFNTTIAGIEEADACLLIGTNPRKEASLVNARLRKRYLDLKGDFPVGVIGQDYDLTYKTNFLGESPEIIKEITSSKHDFVSVFGKAKKPLIIVGSGVLVREDALSILNEIKNLCEMFSIISNEWNGFNVLQRAASRVAGLDLDFVPQYNGKNTTEIIESAKDGSIEVVYLLGADELDISAFEKSFVIYQGHHGDIGAHHADVILPGAAYTEKSATFVNLEGRVQRTRRAVFPPGDAKEDWKIISQLAETLEKPLPYNSVKQIMQRMVQVAPHFAQVGEVVPAEWKKFGKSGKLNSEPFKESVENFYMTDPISRASETMAQCTKVMLGTYMEEAA